MCVREREETVCVCAREREREIGEGQRERVSDHGASAEPRSPMSATLSVSDHAGCRV